MPVLIDGHNLIGQIPSISLADPDDEAKLIMLLRRYSTAKRGREVIVVFDRGVYGHPQHLNGYGVTCHFARSPQDADAQIIRRVNAITRPADWMLVTSDRRVADAAQARGVRVMGGYAFAKRVLTTAAVTPDPEIEEKPFEVRLTAQEIAMWLREFGEPVDFEEEEEDDSERMPYEAAPPVRKTRDERKTAARIQKAVRAARRRKK